MHHNGSDQDQTGNLSRRFILVRSPLLLCLALVSFTSVYLYYIDDLKLYSKKEQEQVEELKIVKQFSDDIGMVFGLYATANYMQTPWYMRQSLYEER